MKRPASVCIFYGKGPNFADRLKHLRVQYADAKLCAMLPAGYAVSDDERACVDEIVHTKLAAYSPRDWQSCLELIRDIRRRRFDLFIVTYDTLQLRLLAASSGARRGVCWATDNIVIPLTPWAPLVVPGALSRVLWGMVRTGAMLAVAFLIPARPAKPE